MKHFTRWQLERMEKEKVLEYVLKLQKLQRLDREEGLSIRGRFKKLEERAVMWEGKFHMVRIENNSLRRKVYKQEKERKELCLQG